MKPDLAVRLLIALSLTTMPLFAMATQEMQPPKPSDEVVLPQQTDPQPESVIKPIMPATGSRGQMLYENHCQGCHTSIVHVRERHRARSMEDLEHWVRQWAGELKLPWSANEIGDVVDYLNQRYYKFK